MILVDSRKLRFLKAGRTISVEVPRAYRKGRDYAAGVRHNRTVCRVRILDCVQTDAGRYRLEIRQHLDAGELYLARNPAAQRRDYVRKPHEALRGEGAVIDPVTLARYARQAFERDDAIRRDRVQNQHNRSKRRYSP